MAKPKILSNFTASGEAKKMLGEKLNGFTAAVEQKKVLEEKYQERTRVFSYLGMEVYNLYKQHKIAIPQMDMYFGKLQQLEQEIAGMEMQKQQLEQEKKGIVCVCGQAVRKDMMFCPGCGRNIQELTASTAVPGNLAFQQEFQECICGAKIPVGQKMCMECGRLTEG